MVRGEFVEQSQRGSVRAAVVDYHGFDLDRTRYAQDVAHAGTQEIAPVADRNDDGDAARRRQRVAHAAQRRPACDRLDACTGSHPCEVLLEGPPGTVVAASVARVLWHRAALAAQDENLGQMPHAGGRNPVGGAEQ